MNLLDFPYNIRNGRLRGAAFVLLGIIDAILGVMICFGIVWSI